VYYLKLYELILKNGSDHPKWGAALNNLAVLYSDMGNYKKSEQMQLQAIEIGISRDTSTYLANCMNIAVLYGKTKEFAKAEEYLLNVIEVRTVRFQSHIQFLVLFIRAWATMRRQKNTCLCRGTNMLQRME
jgi:tetratricopeptide (TPR) repeat protein